MLHLLNKFWKPLLVPLFALGFILGANLFYYRGSYQPPPANIPALEQITVQYAPVRGFQEVLPPRHGMLLVDVAHANDFVEEEINVLLSRVANTGYSIELLENRQELHEKLEDADSLLVILPQSDYTEEEATTIEDFVAKGGKLLLIGDPGRPSNINSLAKSFGILFQQGYLYNVLENDINFQHVFIRDFRPDDVTEGLEQIVLYTAGSINSSALSLAMTDGNTFSSAGWTAEDRTEPFTPLVKGSNGRVLAIADVTFMVSPNNTAWDNARLIANLADYLTKSERVLFE